MSLLGCLFGRSPSLKPADSLPAGPSFLVFDDWTGLVAVDASKGTGFRWSPRASAPEELARALVADGRDQGEENGTNQAPSPSEPASRSSCPSPSPSPPRLKDSKAKVPGSSSSSSWRWTSASSSR